MAQTYTDVSISRDPSLRREALSRGRPRSEESEEAILAATTQLLSEKPLRDISMEEIAREAGVGKPQSIDGGRVKHMSLWTHS
jgi:hypothetical protein